MLNKIIDIKKIEPNILKWNQIKKNNMERRVSVQNETHSLEVKMWNDIFILKLMNNLWQTLAVSEPPALPWHACQCQYRLCPLPANTHRQTDHWTLAIGHSISQSNTMYHTSTSACRSRWVSQLIPLSINWPVQCAKLILVLIHVRPVKCPSHQGS